jgi:alpha-methylacyl-CoA racemase
MVGPLSGIKVLEVGGIGPIPFCGMILSDFGADVVRIERVSSTSPPATMSEEPGGILGRNRKVIGVDLKAPGGVEVLLSLVDHMDVLIEGFRPGVMERLGLGPDVCQKRNGRLIFGRMTGWGQTGPMAHTPGHDINYISTVGLLRAIGSGGHKPTPPLNVAGDYGGGGMLLALGVCAALYERQVSGKGQVLDAAMCDGAALLMNTVYEIMQRGEWSAERESNLLDGGAHFYAAYETADGEFVSIAASEAQFYQALLQELGLTDDHELSVEQMNRAKWSTFRNRFAAIFKTKTRAAWDRQLLDKGVCYTPVLSFEEAQQFPHNRVRGTFVKAGSFTQAAPAPRFSRTTLAAPQPGARMGTHTDRILTAAGLSSTRIQELLRSGVIV